MDHEESPQAIQSAILKFCHHPFVHRKGAGAEIFQMNPLAANRCTKMWVVS